MQAAARTLGLRLHILHARVERDFDTVFATLAQLRAGGLVIGTDPFFISRGEPLAALTVRHAYIGRILKGEKPADLCELACYATALTSSGFQMLILRVSGIRKRASTKHTAGTAIG